MYIYIYYNHIIIILYIYTYYLKRKATQINICNTIGRSQRAFVASGARRRLEQVTARVEWNGKNILSIILSSINGQNPSLNFPGTKVYPSRKIFALLSRHSRQYNCSLASAAVYQGTVIIIHSKHHAVPMFPWTVKMQDRKRGGVWGVELELSSSFLMVTELLGAPGIERTAFPRILMFSH